MTEQLFNALSLGFTYSLISLGYSMVYGIINLINFAHGEFFMLGAYAGVISLIIGIPWYISFFISIIVGAFVSTFVEVIGYRPLREKNSGRLTALITAISFSLFFQNFIFLFPGADLIGLGNRNPMHGAVITVGDFKIPLIKFFIFVVTIFLLILLILIVYRTKIGKAMRAVAFSKDISSLMGINPNFVISFTFALGGGLAGAAGFLEALDKNQVYNFMGVIPGLKAFIAAVVGGIGSISGAVAGGILIGFLETISVVIGLSFIKDVISFVLLILILILKPSGLFLKTQREKV
ncbi:MAG TPA: branched-chain amino acid ABC transporter permease [Spirochaetota bacterium]|nr:branched-chain amino acid ABC transporter permease [Spirochaetota bacterium]HOM39159.1 branched-chain amino acid ABC transporter permease [Spirochaetota bacterium]HPQ48336.1 branched-chain amino acid ABC transporter permease [Spirochaetota bacterium]